MKILINLIPIKKGGGQQVALNFIENIVFIKGFNKTTFLCTKNTSVEKLLIKKELDYIAINNSMFSRLIFNLFNLGKIIAKKKINIIYTLFGPTLTSNKTFNIVGSAYSNIYFPEIDFWQSTKGWKKTFIGL